MKTVQIFKQLNYISLISMQITTVGTDNSSRDRSQQLGQITAVGTDHSSRDRSQQ